ncbi:MAG: hypothetical protein ABFR97_02815 [Thermodesulfobacteriota bacterium]
MNERFNRKLIWIFIAGLLTLTGTGLEEVRAADGDQTAIGVVSKSGRGSFILRTEAGKEKTFNTGRGTKYEPANFRAREGDKVQVTFYDKAHRDRTIQAVSKLKLLKLNPNFKEPANPAMGTIKEAGRRAFNIYIPEIKKSWKFEIARGWKKTPKDWTPAADEKVKVTYKKVPSRWSGGVVYQIKTLEKVE